MAKYFTSDWHLNEARVKYAPPLFRPFDSVKKQNKTIIRNLNKLVKKNDELYVLGDVVMNRKGVPLLDKISCQNKFLVIGNHDIGRLDKLEKYFVEMKDDMEITVGTLECYLNHYPVNRRPDKFNLVGHVHNLWKVQPNMLNIGVDSWNFRPVSEEEILFMCKAMTEYYDGNVFVSYK